MVQQKQQYRLRFAPSPNGYLHLGHAFSALLNQDVARQVGGQFIIRTEDIDRLRCKREYYRACLSDLAAIGVVSDIEIMMQSERQAAYDLAIKHLLSLGVLYPCLATRGQIKAYYKGREARHDPDGGLIYPEIYKYKTAKAQLAILNGGQDYALRLDMQKAVKLAEQKIGHLSFKQIALEQEVIKDVGFDATIWGDVVIKRKDIGTSYHLSVVVDDAAQQISHVIRGVDLAKATYIHRLLQILLDLPSLVYFHHPLILDEGLMKLSKSNQADAFHLLLQKNEGVRLIMDLLEGTNQSTIGFQIARIVKNE